MLSTAAQRDDRCLTAPDTKGAIYLTRCREKMTGFPCEMKIPWGAPIFGHDQRWNDRREGAPI